MTTTMINKKNENEIKTTHDWLKKIKDEMKTIMIDSENAEEMRTKMIDL